MRLSSNFFACGTKGSHTHIAQFRTHLISADGKHTFNQSVCSSGRCWLKEGQTKIVDSSILIHVLLLIHLPVFHFLFSFFFVHKFNIECHGSEKRKFVLTLETWICLQAGLFKNFVICLGNQSKMRWQLFELTWHQYLVEHPAAGEHHWSNWCCWCVYV